MLQKLNNSSFYFSSNKNFNKILKSKATLYCDDLNMKSDYFDLLNENQDIQKVKEYLHKYRLDKFMTTNQRILHLKAESTSNEIEQFLQNFYLNKREAQLNMDIKSETVSNILKISQKLTNQSLVKQLKSNQPDKNMIIYFYNKKDKEQMRLLKQFESLALENLNKGNKTNTEFMRFNLSKNSFRLAPELDSPMIKFIRKKEDYIPPSINWTEDNFKSRIWSISNTLGTSRQIEPNSFIYDSPIDIPESIKNLRIKLI
jgi:hypothetical protein